MPSNNWDTTNSRDEAIVNDILDHEGIDDIIDVVSGTPKELKVGASVRENRKYVIFQALDNGVTWGFTNTSQSFDCFKNQAFFLPVGENTAIWFASSSGTKQVAIGEVS